VHGHNNKFIKPRNGRYGRTIYEGVEELSIIEYSGLSNYYRACKSKSKAIPITGLGGL
jgi:hypothetical protein